MTVGVYLLYLLAGLQMPLIVLCQLRDDPFDLLILYPMRILPICAGVIVGMLDSLANNVKEPFIVHKCTPHVSFFILFAGVLNSAPRMSL
jgi:hypothetical protein